MNQVLALSTPDDANMLDTLGRGGNNNHYSLRFKMSVVLDFDTQIKKWNEIIIEYNAFTKLPLLCKKKTKLKLHWKLCERKVEVFIEGKVERKN